MKLVYFYFLLGLQTRSVQLMINWILSCFADRNRNAPASKTSHVVVVPSSQVNPPTTQVFIENGRSCSDNSNQAKSSGQNKSSSPASVILQDLPASTNATVVSLLEQRLQSLSGQLEAERQASQSKISSLELTREALSVVIQQQTSQVRVF